MKSLRSSGLVLILGLSILGVAACDGPGGEPGTTEQEQPVEPLEGGEAEPGTPEGGEGTN